MKFIYWSAAVVALLTGGGGAQAQTADQFFDDGVIQEIRIQINPSDWQRLRDNFRENIYYPCSFTWRGVTVPNIGIRSSGLGSRNPQKPNLRVDFDRFEEDQRFLGLRSVKIDGNAQDPTEIRERLTFAFFRRMGLPASRETHGRVLLNGQYLGLYGVTESVDKDFLKRNLGEDEGFLYEYNYAAPWHFEYLGADPAKYSPAFYDPKTHEKDPDPRPIEAFVRTVNQSSDGEFERTLAPYLDAQQFLTHLASETFMAEVDGILGDLGMANHNLYRYQGKNLFKFLVWDKDNTFSNSSRDILRNVNEYVLMRRLLAIPALRDFYLSELVRATTLAGGVGGWLDQEIDRVWGMVQAPLAEDPNKQCPAVDFQPGTALRSCTPQDAENGYQWIKQFARERSDFVYLAALTAGYRPPFTAPQLSQGGAVNAASSQPGLAAGSLASVYGQSLGTETLAATSLPLPTALGGLSILINGTPAPLLFVSPGQVNLQVPWNIPTGSVNISADFNGQPGNTITADVKTGAPGIFVVVRADGSLVTADRPVVASDVLIIYCTGLGAVDQIVTTGNPAPGNPVAGVRNGVTVRFGNVAAAEVFFAGLTPGFVGLYQINVRAPSGIPAGTSTPLTIVVAGETSAALPLPTR